MKDIYNEDKKAKENFINKIKNGEKMKINIIGCGLCDYDCKSCGTSK